MRSLVLVGVVVALTGAAHREVHITLAITPTALQLECR